MASEWQESTKKAAAAYRTELVCSYIQFLAIAIIDLISIGPNELAIFKKHIAFEHFSKDP